VILELLLYLYFVGDVLENIEGEIELHVECEFLIYDEKEFELFKSFITLFYYPFIYNK